ncbi:MAG: hypothetical protein JNM09_06850 [Blastocatellia bacterium]|nr:hypothetical protein [Blastocatellia bacterium]
MNPKPFNLIQLDIDHFARDPLTRETLVKAGVWRVDSFGGAELVSKTIAESGEAK